MKIFDKAIEFFDVEREKIVYIGDHIMRDVGGAKAAGLSTVWINRRGKQLHESMAVPDLIIKDLQELI
ncbi:MAG: HAD family hydrolase [Cyanobacteria bacterium P01_D01_bin.50]